MNKNNKIDLLVINANIYSCDTANSIASYMAIDGGKILQIGLDNNAKLVQNAEKILDLKGAPVYPGLYDPHCHFYHYALGLSRVNLTGTSSVDEILHKLTAYYEKEKPEWLIGRGWDQNDWIEKKYPDKSVLDSLFPDVPVCLSRIDGHAVWVNSKLLELAGIDSGTKVEGGSIILKNGEPTGILIDLAENLVTKIIPAQSREQTIRLLQKAQNNCFAVGITSVGDAGLSLEEVRLIDSLQQADKLKMQVYAMLSPTTNNINYFVKNRPYITPSLSVRAIKLYADGALGSRGASLLEPYTDDPQNSGLITIDEETLRHFCQLAIDNNYQINTHCIGDAAVRKVLDIYSEFLEEDNDRRWRIEHAQVVHPDDMVKFGGYKVIPSIQASHATSDMYWVEQRLGKRTVHAYAYKQLLDQNGWLPNGSDFPVESINPLFGFFAAIARQDTSGYPPRGFQPENALTREEALNAMTIWAAKASFEDEIKGSLEPGKNADFVVLEKDIMNIPLEEIPGVKVLETYISGKPVFEAGK